MKSRSFHNSTKAERMIVTGSLGVFGGIMAVRNMATSGSLLARRTSYMKPDGFLPPFTEAENSSNGGRSGKARLAGGVPSFARAAICHNGMTMLPMLDSIEPRQPGNDVF